jgi:hypothetical protein
MIQTTEWNFCSQNDIQSVVHMDYLEYTLLSKE